MSAIVYLVKCEEFYKIGVTVEFTKRLSGMKCSNPFEIIFIKSWEFDTIKTARNIESIIHKKMKSLGFHVRGEWFCGAEDKFIIELISEEHHKKIKELEQIIEAKRQKEFAEQIEKPCKIKEKKEKSIIPHNVLIELLRDRRLLVISKTTGISYGTLLSIKNGKANPTNNTIKTLSNYFRDAA